MNEPDHPTIGTKLLATVETAFRAFMVGKDAPPLQPADSTQAAWERFKACLMAAESSAVPVRAVTASILFGDWHLVRLGDKWGISHGDPEDGYLPAMTWTSTPAVDPCEGMTDDEVNGLPPDEAERRIIGHQKQVETFRAEATLDVGEAAHFVETAQSAGWNQGSHGDLAHWVFERAGALIGAAGSEASPVAAASLAARTVTLYCRCTLHVQPDGSGSGVVTDPKCEIHGTKPALIVTALRAGMSWREAAEKFGTMTNPNDTMRTLPSGRVVESLYASGEACTGASTDGSQRCVRGLNHPGRCFDGTRTFADGDLPVTREATYAEARDAQKPRETGS